MTRKRSRLVSIKPRLRNLCINKLILGRVVPDFSDNSSYDIFVSMRVLCWSFLPMVRANFNNVWPSCFLDKNRLPFYPEPRASNESKLIIFSAFYCTGLFAASGSSSGLLSVRLPGGPVWTFSVLPETASASIARFLLPRICPSHVSNNVTNFLAFHSIRTAYRPIRIKTPATIASRASIVPMAGI